MYFCDCYFFSNGAFHISRPYTALAFDEDVDLGWWRGFAPAAADNEEPLLFPNVPPSPAKEPDRVFEVVDSSPEEEIPADAEFVLVPDAAQAALALLVPL